LADLCNCVSRCLQVFQRCFLDSRLALFVTVLVLQCSCAGSRSPQLIDFGALGTAVSSSQPLHNLTFSTFMRSSTLSGVFSISHVSYCMPCICNVSMRAIRNPHSPNHITSCRLPFQSTFTFSLSSPLQPQTVTMTKCSSGEHL